MRLASNDFFAASKLVVDKMLKREITAKQAYEEFDAYLRRPRAKKADSIVTFTKKYTNDFARDGGSKAGSAYTNTLRKVYDSEIVLAAGYSFTSPLQATGYSAKMLQYLIMPNSLESFTKEMSGEEITKLLRIYVEGSKTWSLTASCSPLICAYYPLLQVWSILQNKASRALS